MRNLLYLFVVAAAVLASCTKDFEESNIDPNQFKEASPEALIAYSIKRTGDMIGGNGLNSGINVNMWEIANHVEAGARYAANDQGIWQNCYVNILQNLVQLEKMYGEDTAFTNRVQIARIWKAYVYSMLVGYYGAIPMAEANSLGNLNAIHFDHEDTVYSRILSTLKEAVTTLKVNSVKDKLTYDVVYGNGSNQLLNWKKFANTLRLRIALRCRRNLGIKAEDVIREVMADEANLINNEAETMKVSYENVNNNENPYYRYYIKGNFTSGFFPKMTDMLFVYLRSYQDPRINYFFDSVPMVNRYLVRDTLTSTEDDSLRIVNYPVPHYGLNKSNGLLPSWGAQLANQVSPQGQKNQPGKDAPSVYSTLSSKIYNNPARPLIILGYAEALFLKAQAAMLGFGGSKTATDYYNAGIDANFAFWGIPNNLRDAYKARDGVKPGTTGTGFWNYLHNVKADIPDGDINKIYHQQWYAYFPDQPFDAWCLQRQTRALKLSPHTTPAFSALLFQDIPDRGVYPSTVLSQNPEGYSSALQLLGAASQADETTNPYIRLRFEAPYTVPDYDAIPVTYDNSAAMKWYGTTIQELRAAAQANGFTITIVQTYK